MKLPLAKWIFAILLIVLVVTVGSYQLGYVGSSLKRISREHSLNLPPSSSSANCEGWVSLTTVSDVGATADFVVDRDELDQLVTQLDKRKEPVERLLNWSYKVPGNFGPPIRYFEGVSKDGNFATIEVYDLDARLVGICLRTQWN